MTSYGLTMSKWAFTKMKPHLRSNILINVQPIKEEPQNVYVEFSGFTEEQKKNIEDIAECLTIPAERSHTKTQSQNTHPITYELEDVSENILVELRSTEEKENDKTLC